MTARAASAWVPDGLGGPNVFPSALPQFYVEWLLAWVLPSRAVLDLLLIVTFAAGIAGAAFAARTLLETAPRWAVACGFFYMAGPVTIAKFVAGHTSYLEGYAVLPFVLALFFMRETQNRRVWLILSGLALAFSIVQLQIFGLALLILIFALLFRRRTLAEAAWIIAIALPLVLPALLGALVLAQPAHGAISMQRAILSWQVEQSVPPLAVFEGRGYFVHYYELLTQYLLQHVLLVFPLCALFALLGLQRRELRLAGALVLLALIAWITATGLRGPLHGLWSMIFTRISAASIYRELYDVMALYWLICVLLAVRFWSTHRAVGWLFAVFGLWATLPAWFAAPNLFGWAPAPATIQALQSASRNLSNGRILWWPAQQPLGPSDRAVGGADPLAYTPLDGNRAIFEYQPYGSFAAALTLAQDGQWSGAERILRAIGVVAIGERLGFASFVSGKPQRARSLPAKPAALIAKSDGFDLIAIPDPVGVVSLQQAAVFTELAKPFDRSVTDNVPGHGRLVAAYPYYYETPAVGLCGAASVLGYPADLVAQQRPWYFVAALTPKASCKWLPRTALQRFSNNALVVAGGWSERPLPPSNETQMVSSGSVSITSVTNDAVEGTMHASGSGVLVFRNAFDPRWTLSADGATTAARLVDGFANGWSVPPGDRHFVLRFAPSSYVHATVAVGLLWLVALLGDLVRMFCEKRYRAATH